VCVACSFARGENIFLERGHFRKWRAEKFVAFSLEKAATATSTHSELKARRVEAEEAMSVLLDQLGHRPRSPLGGSYPGTGHAGVDVLTRLEVVALSRYHVGRQGAQ